MSNPASQAADLILAIEQQMRHLSLWEAQPPPAEALASPLPFCYDTLRFEQWLQWIFLPRMKQVIEQDSGWPERSDIAPLAEHHLYPRERPSKALIDLIRQFDDFINHRPSG